MMLEIKNIHVSKSGKEILKGVSLSMKKGETHVIFGPNGSGKSTLSYTLAGIPGYKITKGKIFFEGVDITKYKPEKRAKMGIALAFQFPPAIKGVKLKDLIEKIKKNDVKISTSYINKIINREVNVDFSGGEKKISELIQIISMNPKLVILDEIDSGLDFKRLQDIGNFLKKLKRSDGISFLVITHSGEILKYLKPDVAHVMLDGQIVCNWSNWRMVWKTVKKYGYEKCKVCRGSKLSAARS